MSTSVPPRLYKEHQIKQNTTTTTKRKNTKKKRSSLKSQKSNSRNFRYKKKRKNFGCKNAQ